jgi:hypothetical protein
LFLHFTDEMTSIIYHQTQTREQKLAQLAHEITKAGGLAAFFNKLSAQSRRGSLPPRG